MHFCQKCEYLHVFFTSENNYGKLILLLSMGKMLSNEKVSHQVHFLDTGARNIIFFSKYTFKIK